MLIGLMVSCSCATGGASIVVVLNIPFAICGALVAPLAHRPDDQPDDPGRPGAGHRHPGGRGDRGDREHPPPDGAHAVDRHGRAAGQPARRPSRGSWRCSASWPCSSRRSSCRGRPGRCSCRCRWPSASRWWPPTCCRARSCRCSRSGCSGITHRPTASAPADPLFERAIDAYGRAAGADRPLALGRRAGLSGRRGRGDRRASGRALGLEIFPTVDAGQFRLRMRAPTGTGSSRPSSSPSKALETIRDAVGRDNVEISIGYLGHDPLELPDQRHLPVDRRAGGGDAVGGPEAGSGPSTSSGSRSDSAASSPRRCPTCGSPSSRPTSSTR